MLRQVGHDTNLVPDKWYLIPSNGLAGCTHECHRRTDNATLS